MDPISNQKFSFDFQKFVLQDPNVRVVRHHLAPPKPFDIKAPDKSSKSKKDMKKKGKSQDKEGGELKKPFT